MNKHLDFLKYIPNFIKPIKNLDVATDCSGIEAPLMALKLLKINFQQQWASDIDPYCIETMKLNYDTPILGYFDDMMKRDNSKLPSVDIYIAGFPCQAFSICGLRQGFNDKNKGTIFFGCLDVIKNTSPKVFILENVKGLVFHDKKNTFKIVLDELNNLGNYSISYKVMNTCDYGIPQSRNRIYIVGIRKDVQKSSFIFPDPISMQNIDDYLDTFIQSELIFTEHQKQLLNDLVTHNKINLSENYFVNLQVSNYTWARANKDKCPCLMTNGCIYSIKRKRNLTIDELKRLQGFPNDFKFNCSKTKAKSQIGNSMSTCVLAFIFANLMNCVIF